MAQIDYRKDSRSIEQFEKDIEEGTKIEREIIERYARHLLVKKGKTITIEDNGVDNSGKLLDEATSDADFLVDGYVMEVKFNRKMIKSFHIKVSQRKSYIKQKALVLWVNGYETENPVFTVITPSQLKRVGKGQEEVIFWYKKCFKMYANNYNWYQFAD